MGSIRNFARKFLRNLKIAADDYPRVLSSAAFGAAAPLPFVAALSNALVLHPSIPKRRKSESDKEFSSRRKQYNKELLLYRQKVLKMVGAGSMLGATMGASVAMRASVRRRLREVQNMLHHHVTLSAPIGPSGPTWPIVMPPPGPVSIPSTTPNKVTSMRPDGPIPIEPMFG